MSPPPAGGAAALLPARVGAAARSLMVAALLLLTGVARAEEPARLAPGEVLRGAFTQERSLVGFARPVRSEGHFLLVPGQGLIWRGEVPFAVVSTITPGGITQSIDGRETMRLSAARLPFLGPLHDILSAAMQGEWGPLERAFIVTRLAHGGVSEVRLTPRPDAPVAGLPVTAIEARVGRFVETVTITRPGGDSDRLTFTAQQIGSGPLAAEEQAALHRAGTP